MQAEYESMRTIHCDEEVQHCHAPQHSPKQIDRLRDSNSRAVKSAALSPDGMQTRYCCNSSSLTVCMPRYMRVKAMKAIQAEASTYSERPVDVLMYPCSCASHDTSGIDTGFVRHGTDAAE
jgi:hypothetical protein